MKQIVDKLNKIAQAIDENVELPTSDLIIDSLDAITTAFGGTPNDSNLIVDKLEDIAGVAHGGTTPTGTITITENTEPGSPLDIAQYRYADVNVSGGGLELLKLTVTLVNSPESTTYIDQDNTNIFTLGYEVHDKMLSLTSDYPAEYTLNPGESATIELLYDYNSTEHAYIGFPIAHTTATNINNLTLDSSVPDTSFYFVTDATLDSSITLTYTTAEA